MTLVSAFRPLGTLSEKHTVPSHEDRLHWIGTSSTLRRVWVEPVRHNAYHKVSICLKQEACESDHLIAICCQLTASYSIAFQVDVPSIMLRWGQFYWGGGPADLNTYHYHTTYHSLTTEPVISPCVLPNSFTEQMVTAVSCSKETEPLSQVSVDFTVEQMEEGAPPAETQTSSTGISAKGDNVAGVRSKNPQTE